MANILFVHNNFPAQFGFLAERLVRDGHRIAAVGSKTARDMHGVKVMRWKLKRGSTPGILNEATRAEADMIRAGAALAAAAELAAGGFTPDLIIGHPGWGETLYLRALWPNVKTILYAETFYDAYGTDVGFDPEFIDATLEIRSNRIAKGATLALGYTHADRLVAPTPFQASSLPSVFRHRISVIHEGVDTQRIRPRPDAVVELNGKRFSRDTPFATFVNRTIEPLRGGHSFFRAIPRILAETHDTHIVIVGSETGRGYGVPPPPDRTWKDVFWDEIKSGIDTSRVHFVGTVPNDKLNALMSASSAHVYLTYPFVLSWSLLEAMASGAFVVASDTAPLHDVIIDGKNGVLVDFFSPSAIADAVIAGIHSPNRFEGMRRAARDFVISRFDRATVCLPQWLDLIAETLATSPADDCVPDLSGN
jgi:glycosyltransferase involved in cell wall biosynthesis